MASDNRKTFRLEDRAQEILLATKDKRYGTENDAINYIITTFPEQGKKITELHNEIIDRDQKLQYERLKVRELEQELKEIKKAAKLIGSLFFDSSLAPDQAGAQPGQEQNRQQNGRAAADLHPFIDSKLT